MPRRTRAGLQIAAIAAACGAVVWLVATQTHAGAWLDAAVLGGFTGLQGPHSVPIASHIAHLVDPGRFVVVGAVLVVIGLVRRGPWRALGVMTILIGANITTQLLKHALATARPATAPLGAHTDTAAWPSGHTTGAMTLVLCLILVAPAAWRPLAAGVGSVFALAIVYSLLLLGWHFPSDVLGGFCVTVVWTAVVVAALALVERPARARAAAAQPPPPLRVPGPRTTVVLAPTAAAAAVVAAIALGVVAARPEAALLYMQEHTTFVGGAAVIGAGVLAVAAGAAASLSRR